jgi:hypothetical protein
MVNARKLSGPSPEPISLADARLYLRQDVPGFSGDTSQDQLLRSFITAARRVCEHEMDRVIGPQQFVMSLRGFGALSFDRSCYIGGYGYAGGGAYSLPTSPVRSIDEITYRLDGGSYNVLADSVYRLTNDGQLVLNSGMAWPIAGSSFDSVRIKYTAGMGYPTDSDVGVEKIDEDVIVAMRLLIGHFWFNRSAVVQALGGGMQELPMGVKALLWPNRASVGI